VLEPRVLLADGLLGQVVSGVRSRPAVLRRRLPRSSAQSLDSASRQGLSGHSAGGAQACRAATTLPAPGQVF
jgi:hypothetical protein